MAAEAFRHWMGLMLISAAEAARLLGVGPEYRESLPREAPKIVALACRALYHRLEPWD